MLGREMGREDLMFQSLEKQSRRRLLTAGVGMAGGLLAMGAFSALGADVSPHPRFKEDSGPFLKFPKGSTIGVVTGVAIAPNNHIWVLHLRKMVEPGVPDSPADVAARLPPLIEFDEKGNFIQAWGGDDHLPRIDGVPQWPQAEETVSIDAEGTLWIFGASTKHDHAVQRFTPDGKLLLRIGEFGKSGDNNSQDHLGTPTDAYHDVEHHEVFFSDGYANKRVIAFNSKTGKFTRMWGAYGNKPVPAKDRSSFDSPVHAICRGPDGYLYVCDRLNNRIQVFDAIGRKDVRFVRELDVGTGTQYYGSTFNVTFSPDGDFMYVGDGSNNRIWVVNMKSWKVVYWFAGPPSEGYGNNGERFGMIHKVVADRDGNLILGHCARGVKRLLFQGIS